MIDDDHLVEAASRLVVFLGLSLSIEVAREILPAEYRGPIRKGDLNAIAAPATVVIVDGVLDDDNRLPASEAWRRCDGVLNSMELRAPARCWLSNLPGRA